MIRHTLAFLPLLAHNRIKPVAIRFGALKLPVVLVVAEIEYVTFELIFCCECPPAEIAGFGRRRRGVRHSEVAAEFCLRRCRRRQRLMLWLHLESAHGSLHLALLGGSFRGGGAGRRVGAFEPTGG